MKNIKNLIFSSLSIFFILFNVNINALEEAVPEDIEHVEVSCGIGEKSDADTDDFLYVIPNSFSICEEDISFKMLYMLFGESLDSEFSQSIVNLVHEPHSSDIAISQMSDVGKSIQAIYSALTIILFTLITLLISYNTINYIYKTQTSGEFMGQKRSRALNVGIQSLIIIILVTPVGSLLVAQVLLLALAIVGIKIANFFLSTFLNTIDVKTAEIKYSDSLNFSTSSANTESMINGNLCEIRSNQQIWQNNLRKNTIFTESFFLGNNRDGDEFRSVVNVCNAYTYNMKYNDDSFVGFTSSKIEPIVCDYHDVIRDFDYTEDEYGYSYDCYDVNYSFPASQQDILDDDMKNEELKDKISEIIDFYEAADEDNEYKSQFNSKTVINNIVPSLKSDIENLMSNPDYTKEELIAIYDEHAKRFYETYIKENTLLTIDKSITENVNSFNNKDISNFVYLSNLIALNYMYGAYIDETIGDFAQSAYTDVGLPDDPLKLVEDPLVGYDEVNNQLTKKATTLALNYHCVNKIQEDMNVEDTASLVFNTNKAVQMFNDDSIDIQAELDEEFSYECLNTLRKYNSDEDPADTEFFSYFDDLNKFDLGDYNFDEANVFEKENLTRTEPLITDINMPLIDKQMKKVADGYNLYKNLSIGFFYITKSAISKNVAKELKVASDNKVLVETRKKGWAGLGSMLIAISSEQSNAMGMMSDITNSFSVSNYITINSNPSMANENAFIDEDEDSILEDKNRISPLKIKGLFQNSIQTAGTLSTVSEEEDTETILQYVSTLLIEFMFENPLLYLKEATGLQADQDIVNGLEDCSKGNNDCVPNSTHPINGLMQFGQELMYNVILILILTYIVDLIANLISYEDKNKNKDKSGVMDKLKGLKVFGGIFTIIIIVIEFIVIALAMLLNAIKPVMFILLFVSILVGYLMPLIPYIMTAMIVFSWFISFFVVSIALPVSLLIMGRLREDGTTGFSPKTIWEMVGNILLKPSLATIAIIFAWSLVSVSIFYVNSTIFFIISNNSGDFLFSLITNLFTYVLYLFVLYYIVQQSLQIIIKFSDEVAQTMGITPSNDKNDYDSAGLEKFMIAHQIQKGAQTMDANFAHKKEDAFKRKFGKESINLKSKLINKAKKGYSESKDTLSNMKDNIKDKIDENKK